MPENRLKSEQKESFPSHARHPPPHRSQPKSANSPAGSKKTARSKSGVAVRRHVLDQLTKIQLNTAGLSGPYRSDAETMERVCANHSAVRALRIVMRRSLMVPRQGPLWKALLTGTLAACNGKPGPAARSLGITVRQLRRALDSDRSERASVDHSRSCVD